MGDGYSPGNSLGSGFGSSYAGRFMSVGAQDANGNGELDSSLIGIPKVGYIASGNKRMTTWKDCSFEYDGKSLALEGKMIYS